MKTIAFVLPLVTGSLYLGAAEVPATAPATETHTMQTGAGCCCMGDMMKMPTTAETKATPMPMKMGMMGEAMPMKMGMMGDAKATPTTTPTPEHDAHH